MTDPDELLNQLNALREEYLQDIPNRQRQLAIDWQEFKQNPNLETVEKLVLVLHKIAGSGASFGCPKLGKLARKTEIEFTRLLESREMNEHTKTELDLLIKIVVDWTYEIED